jgi:hypothetical protein
MFIRRFAIISFILIITICLSSDSRNFLANRETAVGETFTISPHSRPFSPCFAAIGRLSPLAAVSVDGERRVEIVSPHSNKLAASSVSGFEHNLVCKEVTILPKAQNSL